MKYLNYVKKQGICSRFEAVAEFQTICADRELRRLSQHGKINTIIAPYCKGAEPIRNVALHYVGGWDEVKNKVTIKKGKQWSAWYKNFWLGEAKTKRQLISIMVELFWVSEK